MAEETQNNNSYNLILFEQANAANIGDKDLEHFARIPLRCPYFTMSVARHRDNIYKNRYIDMIPYDNSRVMLRATSNNPHGYINASFVKMYHEGCNPQYYIASQGPLMNTTEDFWEMILQYKVLTIVMVTGFVEYGDVQKCFVYLPQNSNETLKFGEFTVKALQVEEIMTNIIKTEIELKGKQECLKLTHFRHTKWGDHQAPGSVQEFGDFLNQINQSRTITNTLVSTDKNPNWMLVHCSAGIGRTGTVIMCDAIQKFLNENPSRPISISKQLLQLRWQRAHACRAEDQFVFVCKYLIDCAKRYQLERRQNKNVEKKTTIEKTVERRGG